MIFFLIDKYNKKEYILKKTLLFLATTALIFASNGAELMEKNCASCHMLTTPKFHQLPDLKAPAMDAVVFHINLAMKEKQKKIDFIMDYTQNPDASKSVCESNKVAQFGVMPSIKGKVSTSDLEKIAEFMLLNYPTKPFVSMITEMQNNDKMNALKHSPFLINSTRLPHMTKLLIQNWDKAALGLSKEQKEKLLLVRNETLSKIKKIKNELKMLEVEVSEAMIDREDPKSLEKQLDEISKLKLEATKVHLKCIADTTSILSEEQVAYLLPFWE